MTFYSDIPAIRNWLATVRAAGKTVGLVPTMGALHDGHLSLVRLAAEHVDTVVVSIFVNPTQFGPNEDFNRYPRDPDGDRALLEPIGVAAVFAPESHEMYPPGHATTVTVRGVTEGLCGASRPGHFNGVATVVTKLFNIVRPDVAVFGQKDAQQLAVIRRMTADLNMEIEIIAAPIVREPDGLAMSSRNRYLDPDERRQAAVIYRALEHGRTMAASGVTGVRELVAAVHDEITGAPAARIEYVDIVDPGNMAPVEDVTGEALCMVAVRFGGTRLIDNMMLIAG